MKRIRNILTNILFKFFYLRTRINQKVHRDGSFPYKKYYKLGEYVKRYDLHSGLELGTGIGLTAISATINNKDFKLDTIEKQVRNINVAKSYTKTFAKYSNDSDLVNRINYIEGRYFTILESEEYINKSYDFIFLDAYVTRLNEVKFLESRLLTGGIFIISNLRDDIPKSLEAKNYILNNQNFELLEIIDDTIFVRKI